MWRSLPSFKEGMVVVPDIEHHRCRDEARQMDWNHILKRAPPPTHRRLGKIKV